MAKKPTYGSRPGRKAAKMGLADVIKAGPLSARGPSGPPRTSMGGMMGKMGKGMMK